jgi:transposase
MRKSFHGLCALVYASMGKPTDGSYYVFMNRNRTHIKILFWDSDGLVIYYKRLERGAFKLPAVSGGQISLERRELTMLLEGIEPLKLSKRYSLF